MRRAMMGPAALAAFAATLMADPVAHQIINESRPFTKRAPKANRKQRRRAERSDKTFKLKGVRP